MSEWSNRMLLTKHSPLGLHERNCALMWKQAIQNLVDTKRLGDTAVITLTERMNLFTAPLLMAEFDNLLEGGVEHFVVDLSVVRIVDADGDYPLLHLLKSAHSVGGSVKLVCPPGNPVRIFYEMMRLNTLFDIVDTLDIALDSV